MKPRENKKLVAIYNVFDGEELLEGSIRQIKKSVDYVFCIVQDLSNTGVQYSGGLDKCRELLSMGLIDRFELFVPNLKVSASRNELNKRRSALEKMQGFGYFIMLDCDEYYEPKSFALAKLSMMQDPTIEASVAPIQTYHKTPNLCEEGIESYVVPFICKMVGPMHIGHNMAQLKKGLHVDPTRGVRCNRVYKAPLVMHHYSWVRRDINRKIQSSSARKNIEKSDLLSDYNNAKEGYVMKSSGKRLIFMNNHFNIEI